MGRASLRRRGIRYDSGFTSIAGEVVLKGSLNITDGIVIADGLSIQ